MRATVFIHSDKQTMFEAGHDLGLKGEALKMFMFACYEVEIDLEVNEATGEAKIVAVDKRPLGEAAP